MARLGAIAGRGAFPGMPTIGPRSSWSVITTRSGPRSRLCAPLPSMIFMRRPWRHPARTCEAARHHKQKDAVQRTPGVRPRPKTAGSAPWRSHTQDADDMCIGLAPPPLAQPPVPCPSSCATRASPALPPPIRSRHEAASSSRSSRPWRACCRLRPRAHPARRAGSWTRTTTPRAGRASCAVQSRRGPPPRIGFLGLPRCTHHAPYVARVCSRYGWRQPPCGLAPRTVFARAPSLSLADTSQKCASRCCA